MRRAALLMLLPPAVFAQWQAGAAKVNINPDEPVWLAGYGNRDRPSEGVLQDIWVKALAVQDPKGVTAVITTSDLMGLDTKTVDEVSRRVSAKHGIPRERLLFNYSHNHSCPVTGDVLKLYYTLSEAQSAAVGRYTRRLYDRYTEVISAAISNLASAGLSFEQGLAGFAGNRRRARPGGRSLPGPVDHDVPVLAARSASDNRLKAVLFGYSCHATAISGYRINGDYPGFAQEELERRYPGAVALFMMGCGGDANPLPRIMQSTDAEAVDLARMYGRILATAAGQVLASKMRPVSGELKIAFGVAEIPFQKAPTREQLQANQKKFSGARLRYNNYLLDQLNREGKLPEGYPYPVQVWRFGTDLTLIGLTGEPVVDYCLRFKKQYGFDNTWVAGYNNELLSYIPSLRVLKEGGYEGTEGIPEYGLPAPYGWAVEEVIAGKVDELVRQ
ncbi:MAG: hypothetical protein SFV51_28155 [Bryobacteraceae bacterium]|nr:hypothetical protein [Bryobacteraceae bacterium]